MPTLLPLHGRLVDLTPQQLRTNGLGTAETRLPPCLLGQRKSTAD